MSDDYNTFTRVNRFEKKRKNTKAISLFISLGVILVVVLIAVFVFGDKEDTQTVDGSNDSFNGVDNNENDENNELVESGPEDDTDEQLDQPASATEYSSENQETESHTEQELEQGPNDIEVETIPVDGEDDNVIQAYTADWEPLDSKIDGPLEFSWVQGEQDWNELVQASAIATGLSEDDIIDWWITSKGTSGPNEFIATVTNKAQTEVYRVYISWIENQGFKPTKVEILKENDQKERFNTDSETNVESEVVSDETSEQTDPTTNEDTRTE